METNKPISVGDLTRLIKQSIEHNMLLQSVWIEGEVSNFRAPFSGHWYFTLKDSSAVLRCVMFKSRIRLLQGMPGDGDKIMIRGSISVYEKDGQYQCYVDKWLPTGVGDLAAAFEKLKEVFQKEGLFEESRKKSLPPFPKKVGLITSATGAAVQDMVRVGTRRNSSIHLTLFPVRVQGDEAAGEIAEAIRQMDKLGFDALVVGRGGGSLEELWAFNEEPVVRAISQAQTPIISAVGHESDITLADFAADVRAATPSQAMEILIPEQEAIVQYILKERRILIQQMERKLEFLRLKVQPSSQAVSRNLEYFLGRKRQELEGSLGEFNQKLKDYLREKRSQWSDEYLKLGGLDPYRNLARGYSVVEAENGTLVTNRDQVTVGDRLRIQLNLGKLLVRVEEGE